MMRRRTRTPAGPLLLQEEAAALEAATASPADAALSPDERAGALEARLVAAERRAVHLAGRKRERPLEEVAAEHERAKKRHRQLREALSCGRAVCKARLGGGGETPHRVPDPPIATTLASFKCRRACRDQGGARTARGAAHAHAPPSVARAALSALRSPLFAPRRGSARRWRRRRGAWTRGRTTASAS